MLKRITRSVVATAMAVAIPLSALQAIPAVTPAASAQPVGTVKPWNAIANPPLAKTDGKPQKWVEKVDHKQVLSFLVYSPSMRRDIPVAVLPATNTAGQRVQNAPTIYLLNGAGGAEQHQDWLSMSDAREFFAGKGVNVVIPQEGAFSYYTDWVSDNVRSRYISGPQKWETFLVKELPGPIEGLLGADKNRRSIVGFSMSGTTSLVLPTHYPGFYKSAASFSGCAATSTPEAYQFGRITVNRASGTLDYRTVTPEMMWGPMGSPNNRYNDALVNAEKLRGTRLYISTGTGLAGRQDQVSYLVGQGLPQPAASVGSAILQVEGGVIEAAINKCSHDLRAKLEGLNIPAQYEFRNAGTHSWPYWREDLHKAWFTTIAPSFGM